ncbi:MAG TPA: nucleoside diphosphate kinase regulator [Elusimicrobiota bacterium]|nr:nucleoside diphosphate kinase regulator [Elusimicrobiota bacterium]
MKKDEEETMSTRDIYLTDFDAKRLNDLLLGGQGVNPMDEKHVRELKKEIDRGHIVPSKDIPRDVITMNTKAKVRDLVTGEEFVYTLVYPKDADIREGKISVLAPVGTALLGFRAGDEIEWMVQGVPRRLKVKEIVYQPEAAGNFHL